MSLSLSLSCVANSQIVVAKRICETSSKLELIRDYHEGGRRFGDRRGPRDDR